MSEGLEAIFFLSFSFFLVGSVGDVSRVLLACDLHALDTKGQVKWMLVHAGNSDVMSLLP